MWGEIIEKHLTLRRADPNQAATLTALAIRSKAFWGYSADFMEACRAELLVSQDNIQDSKNQYVIAESAGEVLGFYALERLSASEFELDALFVEPLRIGTGVGRRLIRHAIQAVAGAGGRELFIQGDPNAEKFYCAAGGKLIGTRESASIPGRSLPLFAISIAELSREWGG